jgi:hypothetical protein
MSTSRKVWDNCFSCGRTLDISTKPNDWRECIRCLCISRGIFLVFGLAILTLWVCFHFLDRFQSVHKIISVLGLTIDIFGAWFLATGYIEILIRMASGWGGGDGKMVRVFSEKNFRKRIFGLICLAVGFFLQGLGTVLG